MNERSVPAGVAPHSSASHSFVVAHLGLCALTWGSSFLLIKLTQGQVDPVVIASVRGVLAALAIIAVMLVMRQSVLPGRHEIKDWLVLGTVNGWVPNILVAYALARMDSGPAALIQASGPLMTACLAHLFLSNERLTPTRVVGILIGLCGVVLLIGPRILEGGATLAGVLAMLLLTLLYAIGNTYARTIARAEPLRLALGQQSVSAVAATVVALAWSGSAAFGPALNYPWALLALGLVSTAVPIVLFMRLILAAGPTKAAMTGYLVPAFATFLGIVVLNEALEMRQLLGGAIVLIGVAIVSGLLRWPNTKKA
ncbi:MAG: DMT family transporter [Bosea sp. (in: a-proteobacteria)]